MTTFLIYFVGAEDKMPTPEGVKFKTGMLQEILKAQMITIFNTH